MRLTSNESVFCNSTHLVLQARDLAEFSAALWKYCGPTEEKHAPQVWQLLYYGGFDAKSVTYILAVLRRQGSDEQLWLTAELTASDTWPSLAQKWPAVLWTEREIWERYSCQPVGHPDLRPLLRPDQVILPSCVAHEGVFSLPLGPVRADVVESGFFLFDTVGEQIMHLQPQLFYKHRGIEGLGRGQDVETGVQLAGRISGTATAAHTAAYCDAVEQAYGYTTAHEVRLERQFWMELERLYNHAHDMSQMASAAGMTVGQMQLARAKEECLRLAGDLTGSRYLRGAIKPFASSNVNWTSQASNIALRLESIDQRLLHFVGLLYHTPTFIDRLIGTGVVRSEWVREYGLVGPAARACGAAVDARADYFPDLQRQGYEICVSESGAGDAKERFDIRVREWRVSMHMLQTILEQLRTASGRFSAEHPGTQTGWGLGCVEGPRGRVAHVVWVEQGRLAFWGIRSASSWIWPVFGLVTANGNIQTDFPVIDTSFGLSYAGLDR